MRSMEARYVNGKGKMEQKTTISYMVQPRKEGKLLIEPAMIRSKGKKYQTDPIEIEVGKAIEGQEVLGQAGNPSASAKENIHLVAEVSDRHPYIGEAITVTYKLFYRMNIGRVGHPAPQVRLLLDASLYRSRPAGKQNGTARLLPGRTLQRHHVLQSPAHPAKGRPPERQPARALHARGSRNRQYDYWGDEITRTAQFALPARPGNKRPPLPQKARPPISAAR